MTSSLASKENAIQIGNANKLERVQTERLPFSAPVEAEQPPPDDSIYDSSRDLEHTANGRGNYDPAELG